MPHRVTKRAPYIRPSNYISPLKTEPFELHAF